jgi:hypothetical protein
MIVIAVIIAPLAIFRPLTRLIATVFAPPRGSISPHPPIRIAAAVGVGYGRLGVAPQHGTHFRRS